MEEIAVLKFKELVEGGLTGELGTAIASMGLTVPASVATAIVSAFAYETYSFAEITILLDAAHEIWVAAAVAYYDTLAAAGGYLGGPVPVFIEFLQAEQALNLTVSQLNTWCLNAMFTVDLSMALGLAVIALSFIVFGIMDIISDWKSWKAEKEIYSVIRHKWALIDGTDYSHYGFRMNQYRTYGESYSHPDGEPYYYTIEKIEHPDKGFNLAGFQYWESKIYNSIFYIEQEAFRGVESLKEFKCPDHLNYIGDYVFDRSGLETFDFAKANFLSMIGASAFSATKLSVMDLSRQPVISIGDYCFSRNRNLHTLKLPESLIGIGTDIVEDTPNLHTIGLGWMTKPQLELIEQHCMEENSNGLNNFKGKNLSIPFLSFDQYFRYNKNCTFLGGNFLTEENNTILKVVENNGTVYLTRDLVLRATIDGMSFKNPGGTHEQQLEAVKAYQGARAALELEYADPNNRDADSGVLYGIDMFSKTAGIVGNEQLRKTKRLTIKSTKIRFNDEDYTLDFRVLPESAERVDIDMENVPDSLLSYSFGVVGKPQVYHFSNNVKKIGKRIFNKRIGSALVDVHLNFQTISRADVDDQAFDENVRLHVTDYTGKREDFNYFFFNSDRYKGALIMPLPGMKQEELSRTTVDGVTYEFVKPDTCRIIGFTGDHIDFSEKRVIGGRSYSIDLGFLRGNRHIKTVKLSADITSLPEKAFESCDSLVSVDCGGVTQIGEGAFDGCKKLQTVTFGQHLASIGNRAFKDCPSLTEITLPSTVESLSNGAFQNCTGLTSVSLPANSKFRFIPENLFSGCTSLKEITFPPAVQSIGTSAFKGCTLLKEITFPPAVRSIGISAFEGCTLLKEIILPSTVIGVGAKAFSGCTGLASVSLPSDPMTVDADAFEGVPASCTAYIPRGSEEKYGYTGNGPNDVQRWRGLTLVPHFYTVTVDVNERERGRVAGLADNKPSYGTEITLTAHPAEGHRFMKWADANANGATVSTQNPYTFTVKKDMALRAYFTTNLYQVSLSAEANGRIKSGVSKYAFGTRATVEAEADTGYYFMMWANAAGDILSLQNPYTFTVEGDTALLAYFAVGNGDWLTLQPYLGEEYGGETGGNYLVRLSAANGKIKSGDGSHAPHTAATIEAEAYANYHFVKWTNTRGDSLSAENPYTFTVESDTAILAYFAADVCPVRLSAAANGQLKSEGGDYAYHTWAKIEAEADAGYHFAKWTNADGSLFSTANPYSFVVTGGAELTAVFAKGEADETGEVGEPQTGFETLFGVNGKGEAAAYYAEGMLWLVNLAGYSISVSTMKGERLLQFTADGDDAEYAAALPAGVYILNAAKWKEKHVVRKFVVK
ncbi:hypothetical protein Barb4_01428 [Bacteroidales bacterium Barb4]|nr:hypothetical protein Barb4_01428 [Bacteroidales bacterium Barb4]